MNIDYIFVAINGKQYRGFENKSLNWSKCSLCDFCINDKCEANQDLIKLCDKLDNIYWQSPFISKNNSYNNNHDYLVTNMINNLKKEGIYRNEGF
jgi:hypothetical protein